MLWYIFRVEPGTDHFLEGKVLVTVLVINVSFMSGHIFYLAGCLKTSVPKSATISVERG